MKLTGEPSNEQIDDYNDEETPQKRKTIYLIIGVLVFIGAVSFFLLKPSMMPSDYVGTTEEPGIVSKKVF
ncbi:MAG: Unknown protein [uncultured Sulfurovum sp.]|uniref:Uncharacterized protein n=1 Tax=uncultured Sulfurovum sp. TaxID=269237 RepID=A0A6S6U6F5_9BACT|nr:MAG: Unknown protein [uncultured Sulfurovum sp.]